jgi:hypothetical protein
MSKNKIDTTIPAIDSKPKDATPELNPVKEWEFKIRGRGTSGWMSFVKDNGEWLPLRQSDTSFISAVTAIEPEVLRRAFPHTERKNNGTGIDNANRFMD